MTDQGQIALVDQSTDTAIWLQGVPRSTYQGPSSDDMTFPIRGAFYYPYVIGAPGIWLLVFLSSMFVCDRTLSQNLLCFYSH